MSVWKLALDHCCKKRRAMGFYVDTESRQVPAPETFNRVNLLFPTRGPKSNQDKNRPDSSLKFQDIKTTYFGL